MGAIQVNQRWPGSLKGAADRAAQERGMSTTAYTVGALLDRLGRDGVPLETSPPPETPRPSPAGREAKKEVAQDRPAASATAPQRAAGAAGEVSAGYKCPVDGCRFRTADMKAHCSTHERPVIFDA